jgi:hypothetical protein
MADIKFDVVNGYGVGFYFAQTEGFSYVAQRKFDETIDLRVFDRSRTSTPKILLGVPVGTFHFAVNDLDSLVHAAAIATAFDSQPASSRTPISDSLAAASFC